MKPNLILAIVCLLMGGVFCLPASGRTNRNDFAKVMATLSPGMAAEQVTARLGPPDDIRTPYDPGGISAARTTEIWGYGTDGHLSFPTLGSVYMENGKVQYIYGGNGAPPDPALFNEADLKGILRQIDKASTDDPLSLIQAVNRLQPLGKDKALAALSEYLRVADGFGSGMRTSLFLILRLLFEVPENPGYMPPMLVGAPTPSEPKDPKLMPLFPLALIEDVPLYLIHGYTLAGMAQPVEEHVDYFRKNGKLRQHPLQPSSNPLAVLARLEQSPQWLYGNKPESMDYVWGKQILADELIRLVASVYRLHPNPNGSYFEGEHFDQKRWDGIVGDFSALHVKWDSTQNNYVFADGTSLPEIKKPFYRRSVWEMPALGPEAQLIIERQDENTLKLIVCQSDWDGHPLTASVLRLYRTDENKKEIAHFNLPPSPGKNASSTTYQDATLPVGKTIQAELIYDGKIVVSPVFTP